LVTKVFLTGGAAKSRFLKEMLAEKIGVGVELFDPLEGLTLEERAVDPSVVSQFNTSATVSVGLALRNLEARG
ncbi:MAG: pilus assembly protein PilM, partial [Deltaproteobacteria bacterium]|nr:pilus assembly protein PilM [Deltaproteobacteria bacterium]